MKSVGFILQRNSLDVVRGFKADWLPRDSGLNETFFSFAILFVPERYVPVPYGNGL